MTSAPTPAHILLVDDDEDFLYQHKIQLEHAGYTVTTATTRAEAEALAAEGKPDLAILDLMMEQHDDGFVLSHRLKRQRPDLPVILVDRGHRGNRYQLHAHLRRGTRVGWRRRAAGQADSVRAAARGGGAGC